ncbi:MAG: TonB-dependent receptor [Marinifilaceae bacterium]
MMKRFLLPAVVFLLVHAPRASAQDCVVDTSAFLKEVVVTGSRVERLVTESPGSIGVLSPGVLQRSPVQKVDDAINMLSGVNATRSAGLSTFQTTVSVRGLAGNEQGRTLVLVDGLPLNSMSSGDVRWNGINPATVQRIEVFKGPGSSLYGSNAMSGVINIISKKILSPFSVNANVGYGSLNTLTSNLSIQSKLSDHVALMASGFYNKTDGFNVTPPELRTDPDYSIARNVREGGFFGKAVITPTDLFNVDLSVELYRDWHSEGEKIKMEKGRFRHTSYDRVQGRIYGEKDKFSYNIGLFYNHSRFMRQVEQMKKTGYERFNTKAPSNDYGTILQARYGWEHNELSVGGEIRRGKDDGIDTYIETPDEIINRGKLDMVSAFIQDEINLLKRKIWVQLAMRYDNAYFHDGWFEANGDVVAGYNSHRGAWESNRWEHFSPKVAVRVNPTDAISLYGSYSQGFRAPILQDLCRSGFRWGKPIIANPALGPEKLDNYELGANITLLKRINLSASAYYGKGRDFLQYIATGEKMWGNKDIYQRQNITEVELKGLETDIDYMPIHGLKINVNYTYNEAKIVNYKEDEQMNGKLLTYAPKNQIKGYLLWTGGFVDAMIRGLYKSKQFTDELNTAKLAGFVAWDARISKGFYSNRINISGEVTNIFNNRRMNTADYLSSPRMFTLRVGVNI